MKVEHPMGTLGSWETEQRIRGNLVMKTWLVQIGTHRWTQMLIEACMIGAGKQ